MLEEMYEIPSENQNIEECIIDKDVIIGEKRAIKIKNSDKKSA